MQALEHPGEHEAADGISHGISGISHGFSGNFGKLTKSMSRSGLARAMSHTRIFKMAVKLEHSVESGAQLEGIDPEPCLDQASSHSQLQLLRGMRSLGPRSAMVFRLGPGILEFWAFHFIPETWKALLSMCPCFLGDADWYASHLHFALYLFLGAVSSGIIITII